MPYKLLTYNDKKNDQACFITKHLDKELTFKQLVAKLKCSRQHAYRLITKFKNNEPTFTEHKNKGKIPVNKLNHKHYVNTYLDLCDRINALRNDESYRLGITDFRYHLNGEKLPTVRTLNTILKEAHIVSPYAYRSTKKLNNHILKQLKQKQDERVEKMDKVEMQKIVKPYKGKDYECGLIIELDACCHLWFNNEKYHIYHAIEARTGTLLGLHIEQQETTKGYYLLLRKVFSKYGVPKIIKTDKRRSFWIDQSTQSLMGKSLEHFDIALSCDSSATFKANVERSFWNAQKLYPCICAQKGINTIEMFKDCIEEIIDIYNQRYNKKLLKDNLLKKVSETEIKKYICPKSALKITNGLCVSVNGKLMAPIASNGKRQFLIPGKSLDVHLDIETNEIFTIIRNEKMLMAEVDGKLLFEDEYEALARARSKLDAYIEGEKYTNYLVNKELERKQSNIDKSIDYLNYLLNKAKKSGIITLET